MHIIIHREVIIQQRTILVVKKVITIITEIARVILSPLVIDCHLCSSIDLTCTAFLNTRFQLKQDYWICCLVLHILWMNKPHVSKHNCMLAVSLQPSNSITKKI